VKTTELLRAQYSQAFETEIESVVRSSRVPCMLLLACFMRERGKGWPSLGFLSPLTDSTIEEQFGDTLTTGRNFCVSFKDCVHQKDTPKA